MNSSQISLETLKRPTLRAEAWILTVLLVVFPLVGTFSFLGIFNAGASSHESGLINLGSTLSYSALIVALAFIVRHRLIRHLNLRLLFVLWLFLITYVVNFLVTPYASPKWLINTFGFLTIFCVVASIIIRSKECFLTEVDKKIKLAVSFALGILVLLTSVALFTNLAGVAENFLQGRHNSNIALLSMTFGVEKQALGLLFNLIVIWHIAFWASISLKRKIVSITFLVMAFPFWVGLRTSILALFLLFIYLMMKRKVFRGVVLFSIVPVFVLVALKWENAMKLIQASYDRLPSLLFAFDTLRSTPFGLGNGGYHIVTRMFQKDLSAQYMPDITRSLSSFWIAPESDLVYFIASFGILSLVFFGFYAYLLIKGRHVILNNSVTPIEKFFLLGCVMMIFSGIGQDVAGGLMWWLYMGVGFGVVVRCRRRGRGDTTT